MKKILLSGIFLLIAFVLLITSFDGSVTEDVTQAPEVLGVPSENSPVQNYNIEHKGKSIKVSLLKTNASTHISLHPNLDNPRPAYQIISDDSCTSVINAGFYTKENTPVGLFVNDYSTKRKEKDSLLFDGFVTVNDFGTSRITRDLPHDNLRVALQTGPIFIENATVQSLSIRNDKYARRMVVATTGNNEFVFLALYSEDSTFMGPLLADVPDLLSRIEKTSGIVFADAINLDGGTASALYSTDFKLPEASIIGSYFCIN